MSIKMPDGTVVANSRVPKNVLSLTGGTMSGPLILMGNPTQKLEAVPKQYLDSKIGDIGESENVADFVEKKIHEAISWRTF